MKNSELFIVIAVILSLGIAAFFMNYFDAAEKVTRRGIDCMPPIEEEKQACLDSGRCYCETY